MRGTMPAKMLLLTAFAAGDSYAPHRQHEARSSLARLVKTSIYHALREWNLLSRGERPDHVGRRRQRPGRESQMKIFATAASVRCRQEQRNITRPLLNDSTGLHEGRHCRCCGQALGTGKVAISAALDLHVKAPTDVFRQSQSMAVAHTDITRTLFALLSDVEARKWRGSTGSRRRGRSWKHQIQQSAQTT